VGGLSVFVLGAYAWQRATGRLTHGFVSYYTASRLLLSGEFGPEVYDDDWFRARVQQTTASSVLEIFVPNPPSAALLALPVAPLAAREARSAWLIVSLAAFVAAVSLLVREARESRRTMAVVAVVLLSGAVFANIRTAQAYLLMAAGCIAAARCLRRGSDGLAGLLLGIVVATKLTAVPWLALLVVGARWRALAATLGTVGAMSGLTLWLGGVEAWARMPSAIAAFVVRPELSVTAYQTPLGFMRHLCVGNPTWNPAPAASCAPVAAVFPWRFVIGAFLAAAVLSRGARLDLVAAAGLCLSVLGVPIAEDHQFVLLTLPAFLVLTSPATPAWSVALIAALLLAPAEWTIHRFTSGWWSLLAYPRLYAAGLLFGFVLMTMRSEKARAGAAGSIPSCSG